MKKWKIVFRDKSKNYKIIECKYFITNKESFEFSTGNETLSTIHPSLVATVEQLNQEQP